MGDDPQMRHTRSTLSNLQAAPVKRPSSPPAADFTSAMLERNLMSRVHSEHTELEPPVCLLEETFQCTGSSYTYALWGKGVVLLAGHLKLSLNFQGFSTAIQKILLNPPMLLTGVFHQTQKTKIRETGISEELSTRVIQTSEKLDP